MKGEDKPLGPKGGAKGQASWVPVVAATLILGGCERPASPVSGANLAPDVGAGYLSPPSLVSAVRDGAGGVTLSGRAPPQVEVRLQDPNGGGFSATAQDDGGWSIQLPPSIEPRMFGFEGDMSGRLLHAEGAVLILPSPGPVAVLARPRFGVLPIVSGSRALKIAAVDYDGAGGGAVSGLTTPHAPVRLSLDGEPVGGGQADELGRFSILDLNARMPMSPGPHLIGIDSRTSAGQTASVQLSITVVPAQNLGALVVRSTRETSDWRTDWRPPGGGTQTSIVMDTVSSTGGL